jgi:hypothetical protein
MLNRPSSRLIAQMDYYIQPVEPETDFLRIESVEEIKVCDPACGSGHMLTYAFDLLYAIYEEEGYEPSEIPTTILTKNLYGIEIDERAGELAAFALTMKARAKQRRFFNKGVKPNICVLENVSFDESELNEYMDFVGRDLFTAPLQTTLQQFTEAKNFGSLIRPEVTDVDAVLRALETKDVSGQLFLSLNHQKVLQALRQADYLSSKYHVVITNPPYMASKGMNLQLSGWLRKAYPDSYSDLMACFMSRAGGFSLSGGFWGMINLPSWMFLSSFVNMRKRILEEFMLASLLHLGRGIFGSDFGSVAFVFQSRRPNAQGFSVYRRLFDKHVQVRSSEQIRQLFLDKFFGRFTLSQFEFRKIPGNPIAYWISRGMSAVFENGTPLSSLAAIRQGLATADNDRFLRLWPEVSLCRAGFEFADRTAAADSGKMWFAHSKGGEFRKWYGNRDWLVNWQNDGQELREFRPRSVIRSPGFYFAESISWTLISSAKSAFRYEPAGNIIGHKGPGIFAGHECLVQLASLLNSCVSEYVLRILAPTIGFEVGQVAQFPVIECKASGRNLIQIAKNDWDSQETSWDFKSPRVFSVNNQGKPLKSVFYAVRGEWLATTLEVQGLEEENNRIFIEAYGLQDQLTPEVPLNEITLPTTATAATRAKTSSRSCCWPTPCASWSPTRSAACLAATRSISPV